VSGWATGLDNICTARRCAQRRAMHFEADQTETTTTAAAVPEEVPVEEEASTFTAN